MILSNIRLDLPFQWQHTCCSCNSFILFWISAKTIKCVDRSRSSSADASGIMLSPKSAIAPPKSKKNQAYHRVRQDTIRDSQSTLLHLSLARSSLNLPFLCLTTLSTLLSNPLSWFSSASSWLRLDANHSSTSTNLEKGLLAALEMVSPKDRIRLTLGASGSARFCRFYHSSYHQRPHFSLSTYKP